MPSLASLICVFVSGTCLSWGAVSKRILGCYSRGAVRKFMFSIVSCTAEDTLEGKLAARAFLFSLEFLEHYILEEGCIMCWRAMVGAFMLSESRLCWLLN